MSDNYMTDPPDWYNMGFDLEPLDVDMDFPPSEDGELDESGQIEQAPQVYAPEVHAPGIHLPQLHVPQIQAREIQASGIHIPQVLVPHLHVPQVPQVPQFDQVPLNSVFLGLRQVPNNPAFPHRHDSFFGIPETLTVRPRFIPADLKGIANETRNQQVSAQAGSADSPKNLFAVPVNTNSPSPITNLAGGDQRSAPVPIPRQSSSARHYEDKTVMASGPMSTNYNLPAPKKPGRKPIQNVDRLETRKIQNREAQRTYRNKQQEKIVLLENSLDDMTAEKNRESAERMRFQDLYEQETRLSAQLKERIEFLERQVKSHPPVPQPSLFRPHAPASYGHFGAPLTPPEAMETDFTTSFRGPSTSSCTFCKDFKDISHCVCKMQQQQPLEPPTQASGPGSCAKCIEDPERARKCRELSAMSKAEKAAAEGLQTLRCPQYPTNMDIEDS